MEINIKLPVQIWDVVLQALSKRPYEEVAHVIADIKKQGDAAIADAKESVDG